MNRYRLSIVIGLGLVLMVLAVSISAGPICQHCQKEITDGEYYLVDGAAYDSLCYVTYITGRCAYCNKPIMGEWYEQEGKKYHADCMREHVVPRCLVCDKPLMGVRYTDGMGGYVCENDLLEVERCYSCQRFVYPNKTLGLAQFQDGRYVCAHCLETAVVDLDEAKRVMAEVRRELAKLGIEITESVRLELVDQNQLRHRSNGYAQDPLGVTLYRKEYTLGGLFVLRDFRVLIVEGLPKVHLKAVMAHELMHVWMFANAGDEHEATLGEGSCEYAACLVLQNDHTEQGKFYRERLKENDDPTYGLGLKRVTELVERVGIDGWLDYLKSNRVGPWQASADW